MRRNGLGLILVAAALFFVTNLSAGDSDWGHYGEYGVKTRISPRVSFSSHVQLRFQDNMSDLYWVRWESGPTVKATNYLDLGFFYRLNPQEKNGEWDNQHYFLLDQTLKPASSGAWAFDFRSRFHIRLGDLGRGFWRPRFQVTRKLNKSASWFAYNEFWLQTTELEGRDRYNVNWLASGFKFKLPGGFDLSPYYLLRNDKNKGATEWTSQHILGASLYFNF